MDKAKGNPDNLVTSLKELYDLVNLPTVEELNSKGYFTRKQAAKELGRSPEYVASLMQLKVKAGEAEEAQATGRKGQTQTLWRLK